MGLIEVVVYLMLLSLLVSIGGALLYLLVICAFLLLSFMVLTIKWLVLATKRLRGG